MADPIIYYFTWYAPTIRVHNKPECIVGARLQGHDVEPGDPPEGWIANKMYIPLTDQNLRCAACGEPI